MTLFAYILGITWQNIAMLAYLRKKLFKIYYSGQFDPNVLLETGTFDFDKRYVNIQHIKICIVVFIYFTHSTPLLANKNT